jgi:translation initiation factor 1
MPNNKTVWSSEQGDLRKKKDLTPNPSLRNAHLHCAQAQVSQFPTGRGKSLPPQQQTIYLHRESSGRRGNVMTLVKNLVLSADDLKSLAKKLKQECGTGGTIKNGVIEMQGEQREKIADILRKMRYKVKVAGG